MAKNVKMKANKPLSIDLEERTIVMVMTTNDVDRDGDIVETKGIDLTNFQQNAPFLWAHDASALPIGKVLEIDRTDTEMVGTIKFAEYAFADEVFKLYADGTLNAGSIRFDPKSYEYLKNEEGNITGYHITESELLEFSAVPIPANANALKKSIKSVKDDALRACLKTALGEPEPREKGILSADSGEVKTFLGDEGDEVPERWHGDAVAPGAFGKTLKEAVAAGKINVTIDSEAKDAGTFIHFDVMKHEGDLITECRVKEINIVLPSQKEATPPLTPQEPSRSAEEIAKKEAESKKSAEATADKAQDLAAMKKSLLEASLL